MSFVPRTFETIRDDMINYVKVQTTLTDFEIGSAVRTIIEAAALEDDEQYFQMVQLLDAFSYKTAQGPDLDARVADFNIIRLLAAPSSGTVVFSDGNLITDSLLFSVSTGAISIILNSSAAFPTVGTFTVRIGEGTVAVEDILCSANNVLTNTLTCLALLNSHSLGARVSLVTGAADAIISASQQVQSPNVGSAATKFVTVESGTLVNGNFYSTSTRAKAVTPGIAGNVGVGRVTQFTAAPPFNKALVNNLSPFSGGRGVETDSELRDRAGGQIQALGKGTVLAIKQAALGVADPNTGQSVLTANVLEDFIAEEVILYVDDGTGFTPDTVQLPSSVLTVAVGAPIGTLQVLSAANFPNAGYILVSPEAATQIELLRYSAVNYSTGVLTLVSPTTNTHTISDEVVLVNVLTLSAESGTRFLDTQNYPIVRNSNRLWINQGGGFQLKSGTTDYFLNRGTGEIEFYALLTAGTQVVTTYKYYTGLIKSVQTVIDGDLNDPVNFPGVRAAGIVVLVETPIIRRITVRVSLTAESGFQESDLVPGVQEAIETYISGLGIGGDVIVAEIIQRTMEVAGVYNVIVVTPGSDVVVLQNELPVPFDSSGNSLVTAT